MKINIPTSWSDVSVRQFVELSKVKGLGFDEIDAQLRILSILTGVEDDVFLNVSLPDLKKLNKKIEFLEQKQPKGELHLSYKIKGQRYRLEWDANNLLAGEYIDIQNYIKKGASENMHNIMAIYLKPVNFFGGLKKGCYKKNKDGKHIQTLESRAKTAELVLDHLTMDKVFCINGFFLNRWEILTKATLAYLNRAKDKTMKELRKELAQEGLSKHMDGI